MDYLGERASHGCWAARAVIGACPDKIPNNEIT
jgi:hypothetical protein